MQMETPYAFNEIKIKTFFNIKISTGGQMVLHR
jgi:hypothetical protein